MNVAAIIVTRGDQNLALADRILSSLPTGWEEVLVWDNGAGELRRSTAEVTSSIEVPDLSVYGRYAAIEYTDAELIYVQDDDCVVSDPLRIIAQWHIENLGSVITNHHVVCNMPPEFRHDFYEDHALVGFGACFHRDAPQRAFAQWERARGMDSMLGTEGEWFRRTADIVFTALTPRVLVNVPVENLPYAYHYDRMYRQPEHLAERARMRELVIEVRDAA